LTRKKKHEIDERKAVNLLANALKNRNKYFPPENDQHLGEVFTHINPASATKVSSTIRKLFGKFAPRLQPEIDIILRKGDDIRAIEVKLFHHEKNNRLSRPYYIGIDQALALLMYGFNSVALWHIFDEKIPSNLVTSGVNAQIFIRHKLELPIDFTALLLRKKGNNYSFHPLKPIMTDFVNKIPVGYTELSAIDDPQFTYGSRSQNKIIDLPEVKSIRSAMLQWLNEKR